MMFGGIYLRIQANSSYLLTSSFSGGYTCILLVEVLTIIINLVILALLQYLVNFKRHFHRNLSTIISFFCSLYCPASLVRIWFIFSALLRKGERKVITVKCSLDLTELIDVHAMARTLYISLISAAIPAAILERTFASVHLRVSRSMLAYVLHR